MTTENNPQTNNPSPQITPTPLPRKAKQDRAPENDPGLWRMGRKSFFSFSAWLAFFGFIGISTIGSLRMMFPRILFEPSKKFKVGLPEEFLIGEVSEKFIDKGVWIIREQGGFYALIAICTHLGCAPRWLPTENKFKCACHGSGYYKNGINFEGPTPRPLERAAIGLADNGELEVDLSLKFKYELGDWVKEDSFYNYVA
ncbi:MAG: Rieske 2Fe-2S domain-containing protein [Bacteroidetes bacterium]|nr:Rieske 2Fe-2S domain-containing protein [Bacteroidota bacterium]